MKPLEFPTDSLEENPAQFFRCLSHEQFRNTSTLGSVSGLNGVDASIFSRLIFQEGQSYLARLLSEAAGGRQVQILGGGLPPSVLTDAAFDLYIDALNSMRQKWAVGSSERQKMFTYAGGGGGPSDHRELVINQYIGDLERKMLYRVYENPWRGLWFHNGSQEALYLMCKTFVDGLGATEKKPIEIVITDPTYPGLLMAAREFVDRKEIKFRISQIDEQGFLDTDSLRDSLSRGRCVAVYISEGNPVPLPISNKPAVADVLKEFKDEIIVFEDRAYRGLGGEDETALINLIPDQVIAIETFSKMFAPGLRVGIVYTGIGENRIRKIRDWMLSFQFNTTLGIGGLQTGSIAAILEHDKQTHAFSDHRKKVAEEYNARRRRYITLYRDMLNCAYSLQANRVDEEIITGIGMFGWRRTPVDSYRYAEEGSRIGLLSLPGSECIPMSQNLADGVSIDHSPSHYRMRQNFTWIEQKNDLPLAIIKDVLLQVVLDPLLSIEGKKIAVTNLWKEARRIGIGEIPVEILKYVQQNLGEMPVLPKDGSTI